MSIDKTKFLLRHVSSQQKRKHMKDDNLAHVYDNFELQQPCCEKDNRVSI